MRRNEVSPVDDYYYYYYYYHSQELAHAKLDDLRVQATMCTYVNILGKQTIPVLSTVSVVSKLAVRPRASITISARSCG